MVVGYEKTSFGVWGFRTLFVRLLARRHCIGHGVLLGRRSACPLFTPSWSGWVDTRWMGPEKQDVQHAQDGTYYSVIIRDSSSGTGPQ